MTRRTKTPRILPAGESAVLIEFPEPEDPRVPVSPHVLAFVRAAGADRDTPAGIEDVIPAAGTVLVGFDRSAVPQEAVSRWCSGIVGRLGDTPDGSVCRADREPPLTIRVTYDGPDLDDVAAATGLTTREVVAAHTGTPWVVAFTGFAPGFGYLAGGDRRLRVPRRASPRTAVPAGSVGLAGSFSGVYPRSSPGGWQLIGRTDAPLWRSDRRPPALLGPGRTVRFEAVTS